jgi:phosphatidylethanolamine-binding protein (PEBP) family uncharacterized protein
MEISYNNKPIQYNQYLTPTQMTNEPLLKINDLGYKFYTLIMYDPDAIKGTYWHWILANIDIDNNETKNVILDYQGPNPPDTKKHRYIFELYGTYNKINANQFMSRSVSLEEGKKKLKIETNPIISTQIFSKREKGGNSYKKTKTNTKTKTKRKARNKETEKTKTRRKRDV